MTAVAAYGADTYKIDPVHTSIIFKVGHLGVSHVYGRFDKVEGSFSVDDAHPAASTVSLTIDAASIDTNNKMRDADLRSKHFFEVQKYPTITFKSTSFKRTGEGKYDVTGDLTLHGVTKSITIPVTKVGEGKGMRGEYRAGYDTTFTVKRSEYGMTFDLGPVSDEITLIIGIEGVRK